jgi:hypothetical protein
LGRVNDRLKLTTTIMEPYWSRTVTEILRALMKGIPKMRCSNEEDSEDEGGLIPDIIQDDNNLVDDDTESSDDDVVDKTVEEMQEVLVKVPVFNPLRT